MKIQYLLKKGLFVGITVAIINTLVYLISKSNGSISDSSLLPDGNPVEIVPIIMASLLSAIVASLVLWVLTKISKNPIRVFTIIGISFLVISLAGPLGVPNLPIETRVALVFMHIITGATVILYLRKTKVADND